MHPPKLEKRPKKFKFHNHEIEDDYNYLEKNWQEIVKNDLDHFKIKLSFKKIKVMKKKISKKWLKRHVKSMPLENI